MQIAQALEEAHERGIVHRDLKPENVKMRPDGTVKVLDFGLAKLAAPDKPPEPGEPPPAIAPARSLATAPHVMMGTPPYMSPEQIQGHPADPRPDIWAFGCLLHEMLTGHTLLRRSTVWQTVAAILELEPDLETLPRGTPLAVRVLIERCLRKDPSRRFRLGPSPLVSTALSRRPLPRPTSPPAAKAV